MTALLVLTNLPDQETAQRLARDLVEQRLAACVNIAAPVTSLYHWHGALETAQEVPLWIKTSQEAYPRLEAAIRESHPYELPEIVAISITRGLEAYLRWVETETERA